MKTIFAGITALLLICTSAAAENIPDTPLVTGPGFQQIPAPLVVITPVGGSQTTLGAALAAGCPKSGCTFTGPLHMGSNLLDGSNIAFTGGTLDGVTIGATVPGTGAFSIMNGWNVRMGVLDTSVAVASGGSGNATGDILTLNDGCSEHVQIGVGVVSSGAVSDFSIVDHGQCQSPPPNPISVLSSSGSGTGTTFNVTGWGPVVSTVQLGTLTSAKGSFALTSESNNSPGGAETTFVGVRAGGGFSGGASFITAVGHNAGGIGNAPGAATGSNNSFFGEDAGRNVSGALTGNVVIGDNAGRNITGAQGNTFVGHASGFGANLAQTGGNNTGVGSNSLGGVGNMTTAQNNTAVGSASGQNITTGSGNTLVGLQTGLGITSANDDTLIGQLAGAALTQSQNVVIGSKSVQSATSASGLVVVGYNGGHALTTGSNNTLIGGSVASATLTTGTNNVVVGTNSSCDVAASGTSNTVEICAGSTPVFTVTGAGTPSTSVTTIAGIFNAVGVYQANGTAGVTCNGSPTASFASTNGIVTHC